MEGESRRDSESWAEKVKESSTEKPLQFNAATSTKNYSTKMYVQWPCLSSFWKYVYWTDLTLCLNMLFLKGVCHEIFYLQFFSWFEPIWAPDKQAKVFSNSVSISPRYLITKFEKIDSAVCSTPRSQNFSLSNSKKISSNLFLHDRIVYPLKEFSWLSL